MGKPSTKAFDEDDYFAEPDYDNFTDEELDELYNFGQISDKPSVSSHAAKLRLDSVPRSRRFDDLDELQEVELEFDDYMDIDLFDDD